MTRDMVESRTLLPKEYVYPSLNLWINLAALLPEAVSGLSKGGGGASIFRSILPVFDRHDYLLRLRSLYVIWSSLVLVWVFGLAWVWSRSPLEGALAAAMLGFSWELNYHSRWVAQDAVMTQFAALCLLLASVGRFRPQESGWLKVSAVAAGLACGMKYTAGLLLIPLFVAAIQVRPRGFDLQVYSQDLCRALAVFRFNLPGDYSRDGPAASPVYRRPRLQLAALRTNWARWKQRSSRHGTRSPNAGVLRLGLFLAVPGDRSGAVRPVIAGCGGGCPSAPHGVSGPVGFSRSLFAHLRSPDGHDCQKLTPSLTVSRRACGTGRRRPSGSGSDMDPRGWC